MSDIDISPVVTRDPAAPGAAGGVLAGARRILILRLDNAGDVILAGPTIRALRSWLPDARLMLAASPLGAEAAALLPGLDEIVSWRAVWQDANAAMPLDPAREFAAIERLRALHADAAIILTSFSQTPFAAAYACYLAGIPIRVGHAGLFGGSVLSHPVVGPPPAHQAERDLHLLRGIGVSARDSSLEAVVPREARERTSRSLGELGIDDGGAIVVAPGATCAARRYAPTGFARAAADLSAMSGRRIVIIGTPKERALAAPIVAAVPEAVDLSGRTSVAEAAAIVQAAGLVLTNNSLAMHLAEAFRRPMVVTYAGTDREAEWAPRVTPNVLLRVPTGCSPCRLFDCPFEGHPCLAIDPADVVEAGLRLLEEPATRPGHAPDRRSVDAKDRRSAPDGRRAAVEAGGGVSPDALGVEG